MMNINSSSFFFHLVDMDLLVFKLRIAIWYVKDNIWMFEINFCNHTLALQKHEFFAKPTTCGGIES
jgi:hypothetical protein